ncbi:hypothetical protein JXL19_11365 [bacterium]|nr:hypothetical protein [bacterium]
MALSDVDVKAGPYMFDGDHNFQCFWRRLSGRRLFLLTMHIKKPAAFPSGGLVRVGRDII